MEYSVHLPGCDLATLAVALRLIYTGDVHIQDTADLQRVVTVCASLGVNLNSLHNITVTVDSAEATPYVHHGIHCSSFILKVFCCTAFSAFMLLVGHPAWKNRVVECWRDYLSGARCRLAYGPADATATHCLLLQ